MYVTDHATILDYNMVTVTGTEDKDTQLQSHRGGDEDDQANQNNLIDDSGCDALRRFQHTLFGL